MLVKFDYENVPVVDVVNNILLDASRRGASDIHFDPLPNFMKVRIRIDGQLIDYAEIPNTIKKNLITRIKIISGMNITESRLPQDGAIKTKIEDVNLDLRVSCIPTSNGEKIVIRILDYSMSLAGIESLGFSESNYKKILQMLSIPNGIILVTGATGSGKSTTVYSMLQRLNREETNIITVEDPIEMDIEGINQVQTNSEIGMDFAAALRSILRQDPDVIMIGEIRDTETAKIAIRASITGHIVLSTIHTNNSLNTIERLLDMDVERYLLASAMEGIISQKLARKLCPKCKTLRPTNEYEKKLFKTVLNKDVQQIYSAVGCEDCGNGYKGRIAIHEVVVINQEIKDALSSGMRKDKLRELVYTNDVSTLLQDGLEKVINGSTTFEELLKIIELDDDDSLVNQNDLKTAIAMSNLANKESRDKDINTELENRSIKNNVEVTPSIDEVNVSKQINTQVNDNSKELNNIIKPITNDNIFNQPNEVIKPISSIPNNTNQNTQSNQDIEKPQALTLQDMINRALQNKSIE